MEDRWNFLEILAYPSRTNNSLHAPTPCPPPHPRPQAFPCGARTFASEASFHNIYFLVLLAFCMFLPEWCLSPHFSHNKDSVNTGRTVDFWEMATSSVLIFWVENWVFYEGWRTLWLGVLLSIMSLKLGLYFSRFSKLNYHLFLPNLLVVYPDRFNSSLARRV